MKQEHPSIRERPRLWIDLSEGNAPVLLAIAMGYGEKDLLIVVGFQHKIPLLYQSAPWNAVLLEKSRHLDPMQ